MRRDVQQLYLQDELDDDTIEEKVKILYQQYKHTYCPQDRYQHKRDLEKKKLKESMLSKLGYSGEDGINYL